MTASFELGLQPDRELAPVSAGTDLLVLARLNLEQVRGEPVSIHVVSWISSLAARRRSDAGHVLIHHPAHNPAPADDPLDGFAN